MQDKTCKNKMAAYYLKKFFLSAVTDSFIVQDIGAQSGGKLYTRCSKSE
jgi:hypothetical protein